MKRLEALGKLRVGEQGLARQVSPGTDKRNPQIIREKPYRIQKYPLLPVGPRQHSIDLVEHDHVLTECLRMGLDAVYSDWTDKMMDAIQRVVG